MRRVLGGLAVVWAVGLVAWAIAVAQGWVSGPTAGNGAEVSSDAAGEESTSGKKEFLLSGTKSDAGEGAIATPEPERQKPAPPPQPAPRPADVLPADDPLLPATKSDAAAGIGGLIHPTGETIGPGGLGPSVGGGAPAAAPPVANPPPEPLFPATKSGVLGPSRAREPSQAPPP